MTFGAATWPAVLAAALGAAVGAADALGPRAWTLLAIPHIPSSLPLHPSGAAELQGHPYSQKIGEMWVISNSAMSHHQNAHIPRDSELWHRDLDEADELWERKESF